MWTLRALRWCSAYAEVLHRSGCFSFESVASCMSFDSNLELAATSLLCICTCTKMQVGEKKNRLHAGEVLMQRGGVAAHYPRLDYTQLVGR